MATGTTDFTGLWNEATAAGLAALEAATPAPMVVYEAEGFSDRPKPGGKSWHVPEGLCGFASVRFKGNTSFGRWASKTGRATKAYEGGLYVWVSEGGQSYDRKRAYAGAFAEVLRNAGIEAWAESRLD